LVSKKGSQRAASFPKLKKEIEVDNALTAAIFSFLGDLAGKLS